MSGVVYRFFTSGGTLLYVGQSSDLGERLTGHQSSTEWFPRVATVTVEHFATRNEALDAERLAIINEGPLHNITHSRHRSPEKFGRPQGVLIDTEVAGYALRRLRKSRKWLSDATGISLAHLSQVLNGSARVSIERAVAIATALDFDECSLFPTIDEVAA